MIIGDTRLFAIETEISKALPSESLKGIGFFVIHILGQRFGVYKPDATALACSYDAVADRLRLRGYHRLDDLGEIDAFDAARIVVTTVYREHDEDEMFIGRAAAEIRQELFENRIILAPDGDEAFDDGSIVIHFDIDTRVRLLGFKNDDDDELRESLVELWLPADDFYEILREWLAAFDGIRDELLNER